MRNSSDGAVGELLDQLVVMCFVFEVTFYYFSVCDPLHCSHWVLCIIVLCLDIQ